MIRDPRLRLLPAALIGCAALALSASEFGLEFFDTNDAIGSPLQPMDPKTAEAALATDGVRFDPIAIDQLAERQVIWVRRMVAKGASEASVRSALDGLAAWSHHAAPLRAHAADIRFLEERLHSDSRNLRLRIAIARYWVRELELERDNIPSEKRDLFRINPQTRRWECLSCYVEKGPTEQPSQVFPNAMSAVEAALAQAPNDPASLFEAAMLWRFIGTGTYRIDNERSIEYAQRAAAGRGPEAAAATIWSILRDRTAKQLRLEAGKYRGKKAIGSRKTVQAIDQHGKPRDDLSVYEPVFRESTPEELAEAAAIDRKAAALEAQQHAALEAALRDYRSAVDVFRILAIAPIDNDRPWDPQWQRRERVLRYALLLDPTDWRLHLRRAANFNALGLKARELAEANAQAILRSNRDGDFLYIYDQESSKLNPDPFTAYTFALQGIRREPANPFAHQRLARAIPRMYPDRILGVPVMPDVFHESLWELKLTQIATLRHLDHPEEWKSEKTKEYALKLLEWTKQQLAAMPANLPQ